MLQTLWIRVALFTAGVRDREEGQTMAEYALILTLVAVAAIAAFELLGNNISSKVSDVATAIGS